MNAVLAEKHGVRRSARRWTALAAAVVPAGVAAQFWLAGMSMFEDASLWEWHAALGFGLLIPIVAVGVASLRAGLRQLRPWVAGVAALYVLQVVFIVAGQEVGSGMLQALHPFNASLLLATSLGLAVRAAGGASLNRR